MTERLCVIVLDALDTYNTKQLGMEGLDSLIKDENSEVLGISSLPYTPSSNCILWSGKENPGLFWVKTGAGEQWSFPAGAFNREEEKAVDKAERTWNRTDFERTFIWDKLLHKGVDATAIQIPIVLPPYSFNNVESYDMGDAWFPHDEEQIREHINEAPENLTEHVEAGKNFIVTSIQYPDKALHSMGENGTSKKRAAEIGQEFDENLMDLIDALEENDYSWIILGDHGSPFPGNIKIPETKQFVPNHRKNSVIISNRDDWDLPTYTEEVYGFMHEKMDVDAAAPGVEEQEQLIGESVEALEEAVEEDACFLFTGGKEALVVSHMLLNRVGEEGEAPVRYGVVDTGNHFQEMYGFRNRYVDEKGIDLVKKVDEDLLENIILDDDDPRGYHGSWDEEKAGNVEVSKDDWTVEESCGKLKVNGIKKFIEDVSNTLITGQRSTDLTVSSTDSIKTKREEPAKHTRINPLLNWSQENVWRYIHNHGLEYPEMYDRGYNHTDSKCCTQSPGDIGEHGGKQVDAEKREVTSRLKELGYM